METTAFTIDQYKALNEAIASGTLTVQYGDKTVTYRSIDDMLRIRNLMMRELGLTKADSGRKIGVFAKSWNHGN